MIGYPELGILLLLSTLQWGTPNWVPSYKNFIVRVPRTGYFTLRNYTVELLQCSMLQNIIDRVPITGYPTIIIYMAVGYPELGTLL